jgi:hypothetical protein
VLLLALVLRAEVFFAADPRRDDFLAEDFLPPDFLLVDFLPADFRAPISSPRFASGPLCAQTFFARPFLPPLESLLVLKITRPLCTKNIGDIRRFSIASQS